MNIPQYKNYIVSWSLSVMGRANNCAGSCILLDLNLSIILRYLFNEHLLYLCSNCVQLHFALLQFEHHS